MLLAADQTPLMQSLLVPAKSHLSTLCTCQLCMSHRVAIILMCVFMLHPVVCCQELCMFMSHPVVCCVRDRDAPGLDTVVPLETTAAYNMMDVITGVCSSVGVFRLTYLTYCSSNADTHISSFTRLLHAE